MNKKYFSVDIAEVQINLHKTLEQAKKDCFAGAKAAYTHAVSAGMVEIDNYIDNELPNAVYGVVLGCCESPSRPLNEEEKEDEYFDGIDYIIESPKIVEFENNDWISIEEHGLPINQGYYLVYCPAWDCPVDITEYDADIGDFVDYGSEVTHWIQKIVRLYFAPV